VEESSLGLFACCDFSVGGIVAIYLKNVVDKDVDSIYSMTNGTLVFDTHIMGKGSDYKKEICIGAHMVRIRSRGGT